MTIAQAFEFKFNDDAEKLPSVFSEKDRLIAQRNEAIESIQKAAEALNEAYCLSRKSISAIKLITETQDHVFTYAHSDNSHYASLFNDRFDLQEAVEAFRKTVDSQIWGKIIDATGVKSLMDHDELKRFRSQLASEVPEVTEENIVATMETLYANREQMFLRGIANVFSRLDRRFKSHDTFKVGSRIIMDYFLPSYGTTSFSLHCAGAERLNDIDRVVRKLLGLPDHPAFLSEKLLEAQGGYRWHRTPIFYENEYTKIRVFLNGNAHLYLSKQATLAVNRALASYYGAVVPDAAPAGEDAAQFKMRRANLPAKDFAFYATPDSTADKAISQLYLFKGARYLEPSAGTGALIRALRRKIKATKDFRGDYRIEERDVTVDAVEIHPARAAQLKGLEGDFCNVANANFLDQEALPIYDACVLNPPFHGTHYMDHVKHAYDFLKDSGSLVAILPVTSVLGQTPRHGQFHRWLDRCGTYSFEDLPHGSFEQSGTMIGTTILRLQKR